MTTSTNCASETFHHLWLANLWPRPRPSNNLSKIFCLFFPASTCTHQLWKRVDILYAYFWNLHICMIMQEECIWKRRGGTIWSISLFVFLWTEIDAGMPSKTPPKQQHSHLTFFRNISLAYFHSFYQVFFLLYLRRVTTQWKGVLGMRRSPLPPKFMNFWKIKPVFIWKPPKFH